MDLGNLDNLVTWLMAGGSVVVVSWFTAWAFEQLAWFQKIGSKGRSALILLMAILLGIGTTLLVNNPEVFEAIRQYAQVVLTTIVAWLGTQAAHRADSERK